METISWVSGKGGTGKTTLVGNISIILSENNYRITLIDADAGLSCLTKLFHISPTRADLIDLINSAKIGVKDALYSSGITNLYIVPSRSRLQALNLSNRNALTRIIDSLRGITDYIMIDAPAGINSTVITLISVSDSYVIVSEPTPWGFDAALKIKILGDKLNVKAKGFVLNDVEGKLNVYRDHISKFERLLEMPCLGIIPHDKNIKLSSVRLTPYILKHRNDKGSAEMYNIASKILGRDIKAPKRSLIRKIGL